MTWLRPRQRALRNSRILSLLHNDSDFVVQYGFDLEAAPASNSACADRLARNEEAGAFAAHVRGQLDSDVQRTNGNQLIHWLTPRPGAGQVDKMQDQTARLVVEVAINQTGTLDGKRDCALRGPANEVRQEVAVVRKVVSCEAPVTVGRKERDAPAPSRRMRNEAGDVGLRLPHPRGFRRVNREGGHETHQYLSARVHSQRFQHASKRQNWWSSMMMFARRQISL